MTQPKYHTTAIDTDKLPPGIPYIIGNEVAERFSFYGMKAILIVFMTTKLMGSDGELDVMNEDKAKEWFHNFVAASYFFPILGALLSDIFLGKFRTIILLSIVYCLGHLALAVDSSNAQAFSWMSELNGQAGDLDQALAHARRAHQLDPNNLEYRYSVGAFLVRTGQIEEALGHMEAVVAQQPWHVGAHYNLGRALITLGRREEAQRYLEKTDSLQQHNADIALAQLATFQYPNDPTRWRQLAGLLRNAGRLGEARQAYDVARSLRDQ